MSALDLMASFVHESGARWGETATPWQWEDAQAILEPGPGGPLMHFLTRPRAGDKTSGLAAIGGAALIEQVPPGGRCYGFAVDRDQARLLIDALAGFVVRTPGLSSVLTVDRYAATTTSGARLEVLSTDAASAYGLRGHLFICDEVTMWSDRDVWASIVSAVPKVPGAKLVCLGSAGDPAHWSWRVRERARVSPAWRLHEVPGPVPWVSKDALREQRALLTTSQYRRLHLNEWCASEERLSSVENIDAALRLPGPSPYQSGVTYKIGCDLGLTHDRTAIAVCHAEAVEGSRARRVVLDRLVVFAGRPGEAVELAEVEAALLEAWGHYGRPRIRMTPWQAVGLAQRLRTRGVSVEEWGYSAKRYGAIASVLFALLRDGLLDIYDAPGLVEELSNVRLKETVPGQVRVTHDTTGHDDMVTALGMAAVALVEAQGGALALTAPRGRIPLGRTSSVSEPPVPVARDARGDPSHGWHPRRPVSPKGYSRPGWWKR